MRGWGRRGRPQGEKSRRQGPLIAAGRTWIRLSRQSDRHGATTAHQT
jgi:hypothetical protein